MLLGENYSEHIHPKILENTPIMPVNEIYV